MSLMVLQKFFSCKSICHTSSFEHNDTK